MKDANDPAITLLASCGMQHLPNELIYHIFLKNTERDARYHHLHNRLDTARHSSQVCQLWRSLLLASPAIWGRLLDVGYFYGATDAWRQEVLFRSGDALLWVTGRIIPSSLPFLQSIVEEKWDKVQLVDLEGYVQVPKETWSFMSKESPSLEWFSVRYYAAHGRKIRILPALFNDVAPRLTAFHALKCFDFNMSKSLLSNIRIFTFCARHTVPTIFSLLKLMPQLTHLRIEGVDDIPVPLKETDLVRIELPLLESLQIYGRQCRTILAFLEHITPSSRCRLLLSPIRGLYSYNPSEPNAGLRPLSAYDAILNWFEAYTDKHPPKYIMLATDSMISLNIADSNSHPYSSIVEDAQLGVEVTLDTFGRSFLQKLAPSFSAVERLCLRGAHFVALDLYPLYKAFPSVTELVIHCAGSDFEAKALHTRDGDDESPLFPLLHTVIAKCSYGSNLPGVADFLEYRVRIGLPVSMLDISAISHPVWKDERLRLCRIEGLGILWPTGR
ncbi:hypothetical protein D9613_011856 [Agrocybe pediades]|uniref:F-box domain-containing protein n=1 Tax=Agrocybe pediades TaxID=84607 RepID=A0A8H4QKJ7_9AGAR|nr:hypothetical protein D9613_011856 [Agrocybe pediades]